MTLYSMAQNMEMGGLKKVLGIREKGVNMKDFSQDLQESTQYNSKFTLRPLYGAKKEVMLTRVEYELINSQTDLFSQDNYTLHFPTLLNDEIHLSMKWKKIEGRECYILESLNDRPFKVNGNLVLRSVISRGDMIDIAHNRLEFSCSSLSISEQCEIDEKIIKSKLNILLEGETGTGKSYLAQKIHNESGRLGPFIHLNLSSFSKSLVESEIFGHIKGAFTGAVANKSGALKEADYGTLFLDEIDSLPLDIQTKLLLFLDNKNFRSVGDSRETSVDTRLIFASGRSLEELVLQGKFRKDMYFRISSGLVKKIKPLRSDKLKISKLLHDFETSNDCLISKRLKNFYINLLWPGNIRQLIGHLEKKVVMTNGRKLDFDSLDEGLAYSNLGSVEEPFEEFIPYRELKFNYFNKVLTRVNGDYRTAAKRLDVSVNTVKNVLAG